MNALKNGTRCDLLGEGITPEVEQFIWSYIPSVAELEILLLLRDKSPQELTVETVAQELRIAPAGAHTGLTDLANKRLVEVNRQTKNAYQYRPANGEMDKLVGELAELYVSWRVSIIELIFAKPPDQIRAFADAFRLKRGPGNA